MAIMPYNAINDGYKYSCALTTLTLTTIIRPTGEWSESDCKWHLAEDWR